MNTSGQKKVLLIAGGGTLGTYTANELLSLGHKVDIICLEDNVSADEDLRYIKANASLGYLREFLSKNYYEGIINFLHYKEPEDYEPYHKLLCESCGHLIFLSSYRIYSGEIPVTENTPMLLDVTDDEKFLKNEKYALSKARCEKFLAGSRFKNYTIARPVISFSERRFDMITVSGRQILAAAMSGKNIVLPIEAKELTASLDWAGNSGKLIARLLFKDECVGEAYTVSSGQNLKWYEIAAIYEKLTGCKFEWAEKLFAHENYVWTYDRAFDRVIDNSKILKATGLKKQDFLSIEEGLKIELGRAGFKKPD